MVGDGGKQAFFFNSLVAYSHRDLLHRDDMHLNSWHFNGGNQVTDNHIHLFPANLGGSAHILEIMQPNSTIRHRAQLNGNNHIRILEAVFHYTFTLDLDIAHDIRCFHAIRLAVKQFRHRYFLVVRRSFKMNT